MALRYFMLLSLLPLIVALCCSQEVPNITAVTSEQQVTRLPLIKETTPVPEEIQTTDLKNAETTPIPETETTPISETETTPISETETTQIPETETTPISETETTPIPETETTIPETETTPAPIDLDEEPLPTEEPEIPDEPEIPEEPNVDIDNWPEIHVDCGLKKCPIAYKPVCCNGITEWNLCLANCFWDDNCPNPIPGECSPVLD